MKASELIPDGRYTVGGHWSEAFFVDCSECHREVFDSQSRGNVPLESVLAAVLEHEAERHPAR